MFGLRTQTCNIAFSPFSVPASSWLTLEGYERRFSYCTWASARSSMTLLPSSVKFPTIKWRHVRSANQRTEPLLGTSVSMTDHVPISMAKKLISIINLLTRYYGEEDNVPQPLSEWIASKARGMNAWVYEPGGKWLNLTWASWSRSSWCVKTRHQCVIN